MLRVNWIVFVYLYCMCYQDYQKDNLTYLYQTFTTGDFSSNIELI